MCKPLIAKMCIVPDFARRVVDFAGERGFQPSVMAQSRRRRFIFVPAGRRRACVAPAQEAIGEGVLVFASIACQSFVVSTLS